ncbi:hypothetical protein [Rhodococcus sp. ARC_M6]|uniref:hypothetical protein n=1 Tax=Rhodococcus sp. ARC_M6 TaxID=2928852 RepID=UPI0027E1F992|nr:hypothetical protein [Rhodococcus sp. ARC_M6]
MLERDVVVSYETGPPLVRRVRPDRRQPAALPTPWRHAVPGRGVRRNQRQKDSYRWRAVDQHGNVPDVLA